MGKAWRCRFGAHRWRRQFNDRGEMYRTCTRCGIDDDPAARISCALHGSTSSG